MIKVCSSCYQPKPITPSKLSSIIKEMKKFSNKALMTIQPQYNQHFQILQFHRVIDFWRKESSPEWTDKRRIISILMQSEEPLMFQISWVFKVTIFGDLYILWGDILVTLEKPYSYEIEVWVQTFCILVFARDEDTLMVFITYGDDMIFEIIMSH